MIEDQNVPQTIRNSAVRDDIFGILILSREASTSDDKDYIYGILGLPCYAAVVRIVSGHLSSCDLYLYRFCEISLQERVFLMVFVS